MMQKEKRNKRAYHVSWAPVTHACNPSYLGERVEIRRIEI
jgi:hypothetical protein